MAELENFVAARLADEFRSDLALRCAKDGAEVEKLWRSFDRPTRIECLEEASSTGMMLRNSRDTSLGTMNKITPEWTLEDLADPQSNHLLTILKRRATVGLPLQYQQGDEGIAMGLGDGDLICKLWHETYTRDFHTSDYVLFFAGLLYGMPLAMGTTSRDGTFPHPLGEARDLHLLVPRSIAKLILTRQQQLLYDLNMVMEIILDVGSPKEPVKYTKKPVQAMTAALAKLSIETVPPKMTLPDLAATACYQKDALEEYLALLTTEPAVLDHALASQTGSHPKNVPNKHGFQYPAFTGSFITAALFEVIQNAIHAIAIWDYVARLLELLEKEPPIDKVYRGIVLQELSNMCHFEYERMQAALKRHVQRSSMGSKCFQRVSGAVDRFGSARVSMTRKPEEFTRSNPQLHYMLRLCQSETDVAKAANWVKKISDLHQAHPSERDRLEETEFDAFCDLVVIVSFAQDLASAVAALPPPSRKKGQAFVARS